MENTTGLCSASVVQDQKIGAVIETASVVVNPQARWVNSGAAQINVRDPRLDITNAESAQVHKVIALFVIGLGLVEFDTERIKVASPEIANGRD